MAKDGKCPHHEAIEHRVIRMEYRMDRLELGIVAILVTLMLGFGSALWAMMDLPARIHIEEMSSKGSTE